METTPDLRTATSDVLSSAQVKEICKEVSARNLGRNKELSEFATPNEAVRRRFADAPRDGYERIVYEQNPFQQDNRRILFTNAYERMARKTQVCTRSKNDHIATRLTHTERVIQVSRTIARAIGANEDLVEAIARGHDIGHAPFGHAGEELITETMLFTRKDLLGALGVFRHNIQSLHVVDRIASRSGMSHYGLNLTDQVRHGIVSHDGETHVGVIAPNRTIRPKDINADIRRYIEGVMGASGKVNFKGNPQKKPEAIKGYMKKISKAVKEVTITPVTLEACIVFIADVLSYCPDDFEDMVTLGVTTRQQLPQAVVRRLGTNSADIINSLISDVIIHSYGQDRIGYSKEVAEIFNRFKKDFLYPLYENVNSWARSEAKDPRVETSDVSIEKRMRFLFRRYLEALAEPDVHKESTIFTGFFKDRDMAEYYRKMIGIPDEYKPYMAVVDYIAGFTDRYFESESEDIKK